MHAETDRQTHTHRCILVFIICWADENVCVENLQLCKTYMSTNDIEKASYSVPVFTMNVHYVCGMFQYNPSIAFGNS